MLNISTISNDKVTQSKLDISMYTNYIVLNNIRENIELKNEVKTKGVLFTKNRYAILTNFRLLIFENKEKYLNKKKPSKNFKIADYEFEVKSNILKVIKEEKVLKEYIYPSVEIAVHWWETIHQLKTQTMTIIDDSHEDINRSILNNSSINHLNRSNIFTKSIIEDLSSSALYRNDNIIEQNTLRNTFINKSTRKGLSKSLNKDNNVKEEEKLKQKKNKVVFSNNLERKYLINKNDMKVKKIKRKSSIKTQRDDTEISKIIKSDEIDSDIAISKRDDSSNKSKNSDTGNKKDEMQIKGEFTEFIKEERMNNNSLRNSSKSQSNSSYGSVSNEKSPLETNKLKTIHTFSVKSSLKDNVLPIISMSDPEKMERKSQIIENKIKSSLINNNSLINKSKNLHTSQEPKRNIKQYIDKGIKNNKKIKYWNKLEINNIYNKKGNKKSYYFVEKIYRNQDRKEFQNYKYEKMRPSTLIEQLLENRYTKTMLRISIKEKQKNSSFIIKFKESIDAIIQCQDTSGIVMGILFQKLPILIRKRINKKDLMVLSKKNSNFELKTTDAIKEIKEIIKNDVSSLIDILIGYLEIIPKENITKDLIEKKEKFICEMNLLIKDLTKL